MGNYQGLHHKDFTLTMIYQWIWWLMMMKFIIFFSFLLQGCIGSKAIETREIQIEKPRNHLELGDNWTNLDVSKGRVIKPIKSRRADFFYDK